MACSARIWWSSRSTRILGTLHPLVSVYVVMRQFRGVLMLPDKLQGYHTVLSVLMPIGLAMTRASKSLSCNHTQTHI